MNDWLSVQDFADIQGITERAVYLAVERGTYRNIRYTGNNGDRTLLIHKSEYSEITTIPSNTQEGLTHSPASRPLERKDGITLYSELKGWQRECMTARLIIIREIKRISSEHDLSINKSIKHFLNLERDNLLPDHLKDLMHTANHHGRKRKKISSPSIYRWIDGKKKYGALGLAPEDKDKLIVPGWADRFLALYRLPTKPSIPQVLEQMGADAPQYSQAVRFMKRFSRLDSQRGRMSGSELKSIKGYTIRDKSHLMPLDVVVADGHSYKAKVAHPVHGKPFNPEVEGVIDAATRVCIGWSAGLAESAMVVADAIRHAVTVNDKKTVGGQFAIFYADQGAGNTAKAISHDLMGILARIDATFKTGIPGNPQGRGVVEKMQYSLWIRAAKQLPTFTGKDMDSLAYRKTMKIVDKDIKQRGTSKLLISWGQFLEFCQRSVDDYNNRSHSALPKITDPQTGYRRHMSPVEMWNRYKETGWKPMLLSDAEISDLFKPQTSCVTRNAMVTVFGNTYYNQTLEHYHGETLFVNYDIHDPKIVWVRDHQQRLICEAVFEKNKRHFFPVAVIEQSRQKRLDGRRKRLESQLEDANVEAMGVEEITIPEEALVSPAETVTTEEEGTIQDTPPIIFNEEWQRYAYLTQQKELSAEDRDWLEEYMESTDYIMQYGREEETG